MTIKSYRELSNMTPEQVWSYEKSLGFIDKLFDSVMHADVVRAKISSDSSLRTWQACWTYDDKYQQAYARMIFERRGYLVADAQMAVTNKPHWRQLVTYLA